MIIRIVFKVQIFLSGMMHISPAAAMPVIPCARFYLGSKTIAPRCVWRCSVLLHISSFCISNQLSSSHCYMCMYALPHAHMGIVSNENDRMVQEGNLQDWTPVEAEIQIVNQSDAVSLCSPHHHLIR